VFFALNRDTLGCWAMRCGRRRGARLAKPLVACECSVRLSGISEKRGIFSAKHRSWCVFDRVARLAERGETYVCHVCLPEIGRASPAVFHGLG
jgi:hypothetical protein